MKVNVTDKDSSGNEVTVCVKTPNAKQLSEAHMYQCVLFGKALKMGVPSRQVLTESLKEQKLWSDEKQEKVNEIKKRLTEHEAQLSRGAKTLDGKILSREDAKKIAMEMRELRSEYYVINSVLAEYDQFTAESQAEDGRFEMLCSKCILDEEGKPLFKDLDAYNEKKNEPYVERAASELAKLTNDFDKDWYVKLPEIKFLVKYKFADEKGRLINSDGKLIDEKGRLVDEKFRLINEQNQLINEFGDLVDESGNVIDFVEFE